MFETPSVNGSMEFGESLELSKGFLESEVVSEIKICLLAGRSMKL